LNTKVVITARAPSVVVFKLLHLRTPKETETLNLVACFLGYWCFRCQSEEIDVLHKIYIYKIVYCVNYRAIKLNLY